MLENAMDVLNLFTPERREIGVITAAELLGRPKSTISRWMSGMEVAGFLDRDDASGRYRISMRLAAVGEMARRASSLQQTAYASLKRITSAIGETSNLVVMAGGEGTNVEAVESPRPVAHMGAVGRRFPLHASAGGKALLAWRSEAEIRELLPAALERRTANTITDMDRLLENLEGVRARGYSVNWREMEDDLVGIGAPVRDHRGDVIAALSISAPVWRVSREHLDGLAHPIREEAAALSLSLGYRSE